MERGVALAVDGVRVCIVRLGLEEELHETLSVDGARSRRQAQQQEETAFFVTLSSRANTVAGATVRATVSATVGVTVGVDRGGGRWRRRPSGRRVVEAELGPGESVMQAERSVDVVGLVGVGPTVQDLPSMPSIACRVRWEEGGGGGRRSALLIVGGWVRTA